MKRLDAIHKIGETLRRRRAELRRSLQLARNQLNSTNREFADFGANSFAENTLIKGTGQGYRHSPRIQGIRQEHMEEF